MLTVLVFCFSFIQLLKGQRLFLLKSFEVAFGNKFNETETIYQIHHVVPCFSSRIIYIRQKTSQSVFLLRIIKLRQF